MPPRVVMMAAAALAAFVGVSVGQSIEAPSAELEADAIIRATSGDCGRPLESGVAGRRRVAVAGPLDDPWERLHAALPVTRRSLRAAARARSAARRVQWYEHPHAMWRRGLRARLWGLS